MTDKYLVNQTKFAEMHAVSKKTVTKWKAQGLLIMDEGLVDVNETDKILADRKNGRYRVIDEKPPAEDDEAPSGDEIQSNISTFEAQRLKEIELARKHRLQRQQLEGDLLDRAEVERVQFDIARQERDALLAWPAQVHALMAVELGVDAGALSATLEKYVRQYLGDRAREIDSSQVVGGGPDS